MNVSFETWFLRLHGAQARYRPRTGIRTSSALAGLQTWDTASVHDDGALGHCRGPEGAPEPVQAATCATYILLSLEGLKTLLANTAGSLREKHRKPLKHMEAEAGRPHPT